jgi:hypothetical protein
VLKTGFARKTTFSDGHDPPLVSVPAPIDEAGKPQPGSEVKRNRLDEIITDYNRAGCNTTRCVCFQLHGVSNGVFWGQSSSLWEDFRNSSLHEARVAVGRPVRKPFPFFHSPRSGRPANKAPQST